MALAMRKAEEPQKCRIIIEMGWHPFANNIGFGGLFASYAIGLIIFSMNATSSADKPYLR